VNRDRLSCQLWRGGDTSTLRMDERPTKQPPLKNFKKQIVPAIGQQDLRQEKKVHQCAVELDTTASNGQLTRPALG
jgi:hypothetical protein